MSNATVSRSNKSNPVAQAQEPQPIILNAESHKWLKAYEWLKKSKPGRNGQRVEIMGSSPAAEAEIKRLWDLVQNWPPQILWLAIGVRLAELNHFGADVLYAQAWTLIHEDGGMTLEQCQQWCFEDSPEWEYFIPSVLAVVFYDALKSMPKPDGRVRPILISEGEYVLKIFRDVLPSEVAKA